MNASLAFILAGALLFAGCTQPLDDGSGGLPDTHNNSTQDAGNASAGLLSVTVELQDSVFAPETAEVTAGGTIHFVNVGEMPHTVTIPELGVDEMVMAGESTDVTFTEPGTFAYTCILHSANGAGMVGSIIVHEAPEGAAPVGNATGDADAAGPHVGHAPQGGDAPGAAPATAPATAHVTVTDDRFEPATLDIKTGDTVEYKNTGARPHSVTIAAIGVDVVLKAGESTKVTFTKPGTFAVDCIFHNGMTSSVTVTGSPVADGDTPSSGSATGGDAGAGSGTTTPPPASGGGQETPTSPAAGGAPSAGSLEVLVKDDSFDPRTLQVTAGASVLFKNVGAKPHSVTIAALGVDVMLKAGESTRVTFPGAGTFEVVCIFHNGMTGSVVVAGGAPPQGGHHEAPPPADSGSTGGSAGGSTGGSTGGDSSTPPPASEPPATAEPSPGEVKVRVLDDRFEPATLSVPAGTTIVWTNEGARPHSVTIPGLEVDVMLRAGESTRHTVDEAGTFPYECIFHNGMTGTLQVTGSAPPASEPPAAEPPAEAPPQEPAQETPPHQHEEPEAPAPPPPEAPAEPPASEAVHVSLTENTFTPATLSVAAGTSVVFTNDGKSTHGLTIAALGVDELLRPGQSYTATFRQAGTIALVCEFHDGMTASVTVTGESSAPPPEPAPPAEAEPTSPPATEPAEEAPPAAPSSGNAVTVALTDDVFTPGDLRVPPGTAVTWTNRGQDAHSVTIPSLGINVVLRAGQSHTATLTQLGDHAYLCEFHGDMTARLTVAEDAEAPPAGGSGGGDAADATILLDGGHYDETPVTLAKGGTVEWQNPGTEAVDIVFRDRPETLQVPPGGSARLAFPDAGEFAWRDASRSGDWDLDDNDVGVILVQ